MSPRAVTLILNGSAGASTAAALSDRFVEILRTHGIEADAHVVERGGDCAELAKAAVRCGAAVVVAGGGDGTVNAVASGLVDSACALGVLPLGTFNHFAKDMGIPLDETEAAATIATGVVRQIDVGEVNGRVFVNNSSLGLFPMLVRGRRAHERLGRGRWPALMFAALAVLRRYPMLTVGLTTAAGARIARRTPLVFIGNNEYEMNGFDVGSRKCLDAGALAVYLARQDGAWAMVWAGFKGLFGVLRPGVDFDFLSTDAVRIAAHRGTIHVATDGEVTELKLPLEYRIRRRALRVIVPASASSDSVSPRATPPP